MAITLTNGAEGQGQFIDQRKTPDIDGQFVSLGHVTLGDGGKYLVEISAGTLDGEAVTDGYVIADAVSVLPDRRQALT